MPQAERVESGFDKLSGGGLAFAKRYGGARFDGLTTRGCTLYIHKDFRNDTFEQALLAGGRELHEQYHPILVQSTTGVYRFGVRFGGVERMVYFKEYFYRSGWDFVKHLFRPSRAMRALRAGLMLAENGFESPSVIAMGHRKFAFFTTKSFAVTLEVENAQSVDQIVTPPPRLAVGRQAWVGGRDSPRAEQWIRQAHHKFRERRSFIRAFGRTIGRMHAEGIFHGDLRPGNVLARKEEDGWHIFFLDNERTKRFQRLPERLRLKNLVQINMFEPGEVSNTDRMRFFEEYWAENKESDAEKAARVRQAHRKLIKKVLKRTGRRLKKKMGSDR